MVPWSFCSLLDLQVPVVTATFPVDRDCHYHEGSFPHFKGLADSVRYVSQMKVVVRFYFSLISTIGHAWTDQEKGDAWCFILMQFSSIYRIMNGINAPKVVECLGSDGQKYRQLAKSGNDDLRQDAVRITCGFFFTSLLLVSGKHLKFPVFLFWSKWVINIWTSNSC